MLLEATDVLYRKCRGWGRRKTRNIYNLTHQEVIITKQSVKVNYDFYCTCSFLCVHA